MAKTQLDLRQSVYRPSPNMVGSAPNTGADTITTTIDAELGKLFEDRNALLAGNGNLTFSGTALTLEASASSNLSLQLNSLIAGGAPKVIVLATQSDTINFTDGLMWYATVDRIAGTATTATAATLPAVTNANQEIFLIAKMITDAVSSTNRLYFRSGWVMETGSVLKLGSSSGSVFDPNTILTSSITGQVLVNSITGNVLIA